MQRIYIIVVFVVGTHDGQTDMRWQSGLAPMRDEGKERCAKSMRKIKKIVCEDKMSDSAGGIKVGLVEEESHRPRSLVYVYMK